MPDPADLDAFQVQRQVQLRRAVRRPAEGEGTGKRKIVIRQ